MRVLIVGAAGMIGGGLAARLDKAGTLGPGDGRAVTDMLLVDRSRTTFEGGSAIRVDTAAADVAAPSGAKRLAGWRPDVVFHLAAVVSGEAEAKFGLGYAVNVRGTWSLLEALREAGCAPRFVFASSLAVYGPPFPDPVPDEFHLAPRSSYGAQKAMGELLVSDYTRKGFVDGIGVRLPTVVVRPGVPNAAASGFLSSIVREPLAGRPAVLPVPVETEAWIASPGVAVDTLLHAAALPSETIGAQRCLSGRGLSVTVAEMIDALRDVAGPSVVARIRRGDDPTVAAIVRSWPRRFEARQAKRLGFPVDGSLHAIIEAHLREVADGRLVA